jgi:NAD(P)-dependent dehydrogenase (short-subunit alcohol dehydrogenase family)
VTFAGKVAVVTGASGAIGGAVARDLCRAGATVVALARDEKRLAATVEALAGRGGGRAWARRCDVREPAEVDAAVGEVVRRFGGVDVLVHSAGVGIYRPVAALTIEEWRASIDTNLSGAFYCARAVVPAMIRRGGGDIVNVASRSGLNAFRGGAAYNASKFGVLGLSEAMLLDLRPHGIRVSAVLPGQLGNGFGDVEPAPWHLAAEDVSAAVVALLGQDRRAVVSRVEVRPARDPR